MPVSIPRWAPALTACLLLTGIFAARSAFAAPQAAPPSQQATPIPEAIPIADDQQCLDCHTAPDLVMRLPSGEQLYVTLDADAFAASAHGQAEVGCVKCHSDITTYPHPPLESENLRQVPDEFSQTCIECHETQTTLQRDSIHARLRAEGNENAATCADCHNPHYHEQVLPRSQIVTTCARCHSGIAQDYRSSVHGMALAESNSRDVPICIDCHGVHTISDPRSTEFLNKSPQLCAKCHADPEKMAPYDLNTNVLSTYVADFHGTTTTLFEQQTPDQAPNTALCIDCHGVHDIRAADDPQSAVIKENLLATCQKCHPTASANFPDAWLSHYMPTPERHPLVYYVNLFYRFFIPAVIGGMALFVVTDFGRLMLRRRKRANAGGQK